MSKTNSLPDFLKDMSVTINRKKGYPIDQKNNPQDFSVEIETIITPNLQEKTVTPTVSGQIVIPDSSHNGLSKVTVNATPLQEKTVTPTGSNQIITPDSSKVGLSKVTVNAVTLQQKSVTPSRETKNVTPDNDYSGLSKVTVNGDVNLVSWYIVKDITIFGVTGTREAVSQMPHYVASGTTPDGSLTIGTIDAAEVPTSFVYITYVGGDGKIATYSIDRNDGTISVPYGYRYYGYPLQLIKIEGNAELAMNSGSYSIVVGNMYLTVTDSDASYWVLRIGNKLYAFII